MEHQNRTSKLFFLGFLKTVKEETSKAENELISDISKFSRHLKLNIESSND